MGFALSDMQVTSGAFRPHGEIPRRHTGQGEDRSPPLSWSGTPDGTRAYVVICHDPDAPLVKQGSYGFVHWALYGLPASTTSLDEGTSQGIKGRNDAGSSGYSGPKPPPGHGIHHYYFWVLALDRELELEPGLEMSNLLERIEPHVLGMNRLVGTYQVG